MCKSECVCVREREKERERCSRQFNTHMHGTRVYLINSLHIQPEQLLSYCSLKLDSKCSDEVS